MALLAEAPAAGTRTTDFNRVDRHSAVNSARTLRLQIGDDLFYLGRRETRPCCRQQPPPTATPWLVSTGDLNCIVLGSMSNGTSFVTHTSDLRPGRPSAAKATSWNISSEQVDI